jgi:hypothetical protein
MSTEKPRFLGKGAVRCEKCRYEFYLKARKLRCPHEFRAAFKRKMKRLGYEI